MLSSVVIDMFMESHPQLTEGPDNLLLDLYLLTLLQSSYEGSYRNLTGSHF